MNTIAMCQCSDASTPSCPRITADTGCGSRSRPSQQSHRLLACSAQQIIQTRPFLFPIGILVSQSLFERLDLRTDLGRFRVVLFSRGIEGGLRLVDGALPSLAVLLSNGFFPVAFASAALLFRCIGRSSLPVAHVPERRSPMISVGSWAFSLNEPPDPTGRLRTTPGAAMVAATTSGSSVSLAAPWWNRLLSAPQASSAAFIDGAAMARSKKPRDVFKVFSFLAMRICEG